MGTEDLPEGMLQEVDETDLSWVRAGLMANAPPRPAKGYVVVPKAWLARVLPVVRSPRHLAVAELLYSECLKRWGRTTVALPNGELQTLGIDRLTKYRALGRLQKAGAVTIEVRNGRSVQVTLHWFP